MVVCVKSDCCCSAEDIDGAVNRSFMTLDAHDKIAQFKESTASKKSRNASEKKKDNPGSSIEPFAKSFNT